MNLDFASADRETDLRVEKGRFGLLDSAGARKEGTQRILCELTLRKGQVAWDLNGLASEDWQSYWQRTDANRRQASSWASGR